MKEPGWYYRLGQFFKVRFGEKVYKIPVHAGFTCPNRDGSISKQGCIFCYNPGFSPATDNMLGQEAPDSITDQVQKFQSKKENSATSFPQKKYLVYFQTYSNTYGEPSYLKKLYEEALSLAGVIGISVGTRPDCISPGALQVLADLARDYHVWVELGLQSSHNETLEKIRRGHDYACFKKAVNQLARSGVWICTHLINGLPGEDHKMMIDTVKRLNTLPVHGIKFHQLQVIKHTSLEKMYYRNEIKVLSCKEYLEMVCDQLEHLRDDIVIHRLMSEANQRELLLAPQWDLGGGQFSQMVEARLRERETYQGLKTN